jgi:hypothetical protein
MMYRSFLLACLLSLLASNAMAQCCNYTLNMTDSYGDGWNGGDVEVFINSTSAGTYAATNFGSSASFLICQGDQVDLVYSSGNWENENEYQWFDANGTILFQDGPNPNTGSVYSGTGDCNATLQPGEVPCLALPLDTGQCISGDNTAFGASGFTPNCADYQGEDIWFAITVPPSGNISVNTEGNGGINDTGLALWESTACTNLNMLGCDDDSGNNLYSFLAQYSLTPGSIVYAQVWAYGGGTGSFDICANDLGSVVLDSSALPIVDIYTNNQTIVDDPKIDVFMRMMYNGVGNMTYVSDSANEYYGNAGIEIRGASSAGYPQTPYGFETRDSIGNNNNVSFLGMPAENDWVLLSNYNDKSFVRNILAQHLFREMGNYGPRMTLCEVLIDSAYQGIYVIGEKLKRDNGRVNIAKLDTSENTGDDVTGGYIIKSDLGNSSNSWFSNYSPIDHPTFNVRLVYHYPDADDITTAQQTYIQEYVDSMETALYSASYDDPVIGYRKYLDVPSFVDYFILNEVARNNDGFKKSRYYHKDKFSKGGKLKAGPTWDFDWAWKNINECSIFAATDGSGFAHLINDCNPDNNSPGWYIKMLQDTVFANSLRCTYEYYRHSLGILDTAYMFNYIDSVATLVQNAQQRHYQKWPTLGINVGTPEIGPIPTTFQGEIDYLKSWIALRIDWLDANMPGTCYGDITDIPITEEPELVVFPNPTSGSVTFRGNMENAQLHIYSATGQLVDQLKLTGNGGQWDYYFKQPGIYFYHVLFEGNIQKKGKVVVQ